MIILMPTGWELLTHLISDAAMKAGILSTGFHFILIRLCQLIIPLARDFTLLYLMKLHQEK